MRGVLIIFISIFFRQIAGADNDNSQIYPITRTNSNNGNASVVTGGGDLKKIKFVFEHSDDAWSYLLLPDDIKNSNLELEISPQIYFEGSIVNDVLCVKNWFMLAPFYVSSRDKEGRQSVMALKSHEQFACSCGSFIKNKNIKQMRVGSSDGGHKFLDAYGCTPGYWIDGGFLLLSKNVFINLEWHDNEFIEALPQDANDAMAALIDRVHCCTENIFYFEKQATRNPKIQRIKQWYISNPVFMSDDSNMTQHKAGMLAPEHFPDRDMDEQITYAKEHALEFVELP